MNHFRIRVVLLHLCSGSVFTEATHLAPNDVVKSNYNHARNKFDLEHLIKEIHPSRALCWLSMGVGTLTLQCKYINPAI